MNDKSLISVYCGWSPIKYTPKFENIHLFHEWKYHFTADLLFYLFGFSSFAYAKLTCKVRSYPLKKEFSCSVILPLMKWMSVFCLGISFLDHKVAWLFVYLNFTNLWDLCNWFLKACTQIKHRKCTLASLFIIEMSYTILLFNVWHLKFYSSVISLHARFHNPCKWLWGHKRLFIATAHFHSHEMIIYIKNRLGHLLIINK